jgi:hypothetical protein
MPTLPATILALAALCVAVYVVAGNFIEDMQREPKKPKRK